MRRADLFFLVSLFIFIFSVVSLLNAWGSLVDSSKLTGETVSVGIINFTIEEVALVNFTVDRVDWGAGYVFENASYAVIDTLGNVSNGTWDPVGSGFVISNVGNLNLTLNFSAGKDATSFIGGGEPSYKYRISNVDEGACSPPTGFNLGEFYEMPSAGSSTKICEVFSVGKNIVFDLALVIPYNSLVGNLSDEISVSFSEA